MFILYSAIGNPVGSPSTSSSGADLRTPPKEVVESESAVDVDNDATNGGSTATGSGSGSGRELISSISSVTKAENVTSETEPNVNLTFML